MSDGVRYFGNTRLLQGLLQLICAKGAVGLVSGGGSVTSNRPSGEIGEIAGMTRRAGVMPGFAQVLRGETKGKGDGEFL